MGCGASNAKSAQIVDTNDIPHQRSFPHGHTYHSAEGVKKGQGVEAAYSDESGIETAVRNIIANSPSGGAKTVHVDVLVGTEGSLIQASSSTSDFPRPVAFEVPMSIEGSDSSVKSPPRRLAKLDTAPQLTTAMLAEKQRVAEERKKQELKKRANPRLSKKDRLRREVMAAREMEEAQRQYEEIERKQSAGSLQRNKLHAQVVDKQQQREARAKRAREKAVTITGEEDSSYVVSADLEVDSMFNADQQTNFWDSSTESLSMGKTAVQSGGEGKGNGDPFCSGEDISKCSSVNHLEQYM